jgi:hypothetical protein
MAWPRSGITVVGHATVLPWPPLHPSPGNPTPLATPLLLLLLLDMCLLHPCVCCCHAILADVHAMLLFLLFL